MAIPRPHPELFPRRLGERSEGCPLLQARGAVTVYPSPGSQMWRWKATVPNCLHSSLKNIEHVQPALVQKKEKNRTTNILVPVGFPPPTPQTTRATRSLVQGPQEAGGSPWDFRGGRGEGDQQYEVVGRGRGSRPRPHLEPPEGAAGSCSCSPSSDGGGRGACSVVKPGFTPVVLKDKAPDPYGLVPMSLVL